MTDLTHQPAPPIPTATDPLDLQVEGMTCGSCAARVQRVLGRQPGVASAEVNFATGTARVVPQGAVAFEQLRAAVDRIGYRIIPLAAGAPPQDNAAAQAAAEATWWRRLLVAAPLALGVVVLAMAPGGGVRQGWAWLVVERPPAYAWNSTRSRVCGPASRSSSSLT